MPALRLLTLDTEITWLGRVPEGMSQMESIACRTLDLTFAGPKGEAHAGLTRQSCSRVAALYSRGTTIRNTRQLSILSAEELELVARDMRLAATLDPALVGASLVLRGVPDLTHLPPSTRMLAPSGACLVVDMENRSCTLPARPIEREHPGHGSGFKQAAQGRRGVTAWVEAEGAIHLGDQLRLFMPDQPAWAGMHTISQEEWPHA